MITTTSAVGLVGFYINGVWEKPQGRTTLPVTNPATGAVLAEAPYATPAECRPRRSRRARGVPEVARRAGGGPRAGALPLQSAAGGALRGSGAILTARERQDRSRTPRWKFAAPSRWWKWRAACPA